MIIKRKIKEYKKKLLEDQIKSKQAVISNLKSDLGEIKAARAQFLKESVYLANIESVQKEIDKYQKSINILKEKLKKYEIQDAR
jgi:hypothetical protein